MIRFCSDRMTFRELKVEDVTDTYVEWMNDSTINRHLEARFDHHDHESVQEFVNIQFQDPNSFLLRMALDDNDLHIGNIKLGPIDRRHESSQISLFIGEQSQHGNGLGTEAIVRVTRWGFEECALKRIEAGCYEDNLGSLRAFLKAGYAVEGFRRSAVNSVDGKRIGAFWFARLVSDPDERR